jgi:hypothetical protein
MWRGEDYTEHQLKMQEQEAALRQADMLLFDEGIPAEDLDQPRQQQNQHEVQVHPPRLSQVLSAAVDVPELHLHQHMQQPPLYLYQQPQLLLPFQQQPQQHERHYVQTSKPGQSTQLAPADAPSIEAAFTPSAAVLVDYKCPHCSRDFSSMHPNARNGCMARHMKKCSTEHSVAEGGAANSLNLRTNF